MTRTIEKNLDEIENNWPKNIPAGIIHADLFPDNIFFKNEKFTGIIDFYFSCHDFFVYDIAITVNAWCFNNKGKFDNDNFQMEPILKSEFSAAGVTDSLSTALMQSSTKRRSLITEPFLISMCWFSLIWLKT